MKRGITMWILLTALGTAVPCFAADGIAWGPSANGMQLGITFAPVSSEPALSIFLQNTSTAPQQILIGWQAARGTAVSIKFDVRDPDGNPHECFEINSLTAAGGLILPAAVRLTPGATHAVHLLLSNIICIQKTADITLEALMKQRFTLRISMETDDKTVQCAGMPSAWTGKMSSGEISLPQ